MSGRRIRCTRSAGSAIRPIAADREEGSMRWRPAMRLTKLGVIVSALATPALGFAQAEPPQDGWHFEATPYLWAAGLSGWTRVGARTPTAKFDANFSDVWRNLDFGAMGAFEARNGRWAILFDAIYVKLSKTSDPLLGGALGTARLKGDQTILQLAGAYRGKRLGWAVSSRARE